MRSSAHGSREWQSRRHWRALELRVDGGGPGDAHQFALQGHQRSPTVAGVDGGIGLDRVGNRGETARSSALTMPLVTVCVMPSGLPMASPSCPTCNFEESPSVAAVSFRGG